MDITEKMVSFQIIQNALIVKRTLVESFLARVESPHEVKAYH